MNENIFDKDRITKSHDLKTTHDSIATNYQKLDFGNGHFLHTSQPATIDTAYQFEANFEDVIAEGERYDTGLTEENDCKVVDLSCLSKASILGKDFNYLYARNMSKQKHDENRGKNDSRIKHQPEDGYYWGRKYAWREFDLVLPRDAFEGYLIGYVKYPTIECITETKGYPKGEGSIAFREGSPKKAVDELVDTVVVINKGPYFKSPLYFNNEKRFIIKDVPTITDKK